MILVVTNKSDSHADAVIRLLAEASRSVFRLNTEDMLTKYRVDLNIRDDKTWDGTIEDETGRILRLAELRSAWLRKPNFALAGLEASLPEGVATFISAEVKNVVDILYSLPAVTWVNDPYAANKARVKFQQLLLARDLGCSVPKTLITNSPTKARSFFVTCPSGTLTKSIYTSNVDIHGVSQGILSRRLTAIDFESHCHSIASCPTLLQEYCDKQFELRVTIVGNSVTAVRIDSQNSAKTQVDWRADTMMNPHHEFSLPPKIESFCLKFMAHQKLLYGAMDFIVTPNNEYIFLENNPYGNYRWLEGVTSANISGKIATLLSTLDDSK